MTKKKRIAGYFVLVNGQIWPPSQVRGKYPTKAQAKKLRKKVKAEMGKARVTIAAARSL